MPAIKTTPTHTENGEAFEPVTEDLHPHGEDPDTPPPETCDELSDELAELGIKLHDAALILRRISGRFEGEGHEQELGTVMAAAGLAKRADTRLEEAADALKRKHTENVGWRMHEVALPVGNANSLISDWMGGYPSDRAKAVSGTLYAASWTFDYVQKRLNFLVDEAELSFLDD